MTHAGVETCISDASSAIAGVGVGAVFALRGEAGDASAGALLQGPFGQVLAVPQRRGTGL
jgi:hypothetical protein